MSPIDTQTQPIITSNSRHRPRRERLIPETDITLDLERLGCDEGLRKALIPLVNDMLPGWDDVSHEDDIEIIRVQGALTNCVFFVTNRLQNNKVLLRIYGHGVEQLCDRNRELAFLEMLSTLNIGPKLLGIFKNGRFEEYLQAKALLSAELRDPSVSRDIAQCMAQLHDVSSILPPQIDVEPVVWQNIDKWYNLALNATYTEEQRENLKDFGLKLLRNEIQDLKSKLKIIGSPIIFAHNDTQYGNILRQTGAGSNQLVVVDFEYAGYNYQAFDLANHFCEWMYDYSSSEAHIMDISKYPNPSEQKNFLESYIKNLTSGDHVDINSLMLDIDKFKLASHVMWGIWGLVQSSQARHIDFDYFSYGIQRLKQFRISRDEIY